MRLVFRLAATGATQVSVSRSGATLMCNWPHNGKDNNNRLDRKNWPENNNCTL
jgi:hypothetical protein